MTHNIPLQKDLEILRTTANRPMGRYEYMLFHKGVHISTRVDNREMKFGAVFAMKDGKLILESLRANNGAFEQYILEDNFTFIVPITIQS